ncbi:MAG: MBL fold metallo-hydrolase [Spirochaetes bacterium]|nr:MBL fold metallo-hydrolase [Spirochaetota bacterium]
MGRVFRLIQHAAAGTIACAALMGCTDTIVERAVNRAVEGAGSRYLNDGGLHLFLCGTGTPLATRGRAGACTAVIAGGRFILVDAGPGSWATIADEGLPEGRLWAVLLTHYHSDHIAGLGEACTNSWIKGRRTPLPVYGPEGVARVVDGFNAAYAQDRRYRIAHHGEANMPPAAGIMEARRIDLPSPGDSAVVAESEELRITAFTVDHTPAAPAVGYRFDYRGMSAVISGDTKRCGNLARHAVGADVLVHEVMAKHLAAAGILHLRALGRKRLAAMAAQATESHTTAGEAAALAQAAGVKRLVFTHISPPLSPLLPDLLMRRLFFDGFETQFNGPVVFGTDGMWIHVKRSAEGR